LVKHLNPVIRGWANYHKSVVSKAVFNRVDWQIYNALWRWAKRRHAKKGKRWIAKRYWRTINMRKWCFTADLSEMDKDGKRKTITMMQAARISIRRHVKVKAQANPHDPEWEQYFEQRAAWKMQQSLAGQKTLLSVWRKYEGICPICDQRITRESGWHAHHLVRKVDGGLWNSSNLVLLHPFCHNKVHGLNLSVESSLAPAVAGA